MDHATIDDARFGIYTAACLGAAWKGGPGFLGAARPSSGGACQGLRQPRPGSMGKRKAREMEKADNTNGAEPSTSAPEPEFKNKERVLIVSSRGITFRCGGWALALPRPAPAASSCGVPCRSSRSAHARGACLEHLNTLHGFPSLALSRYRHLMLDMVQLLPHSKKDAKMDTKSERNLINEVAELKVRARGLVWLHAQASGCVSTGPGFGIWVGGARSAPPPRPGAALPLVSTQFWFTCDRAARQACFSRRASTRTCTSGWAKCPPAPPSNSTSPTVRAGLRACAGGHGRAALVLWATGGRVCQERQC